VAQQAHPQRVLSLAQLQAQVLRVAAAVVTVAVVMVAVVVLLQRRALRAVAAVVEADRVAVQPLRLAHGRLPRACS
jgi:hypothetical protein